MKEKQRKRLVVAVLFGVPLSAYVLFSSRGIFARVNLELEKRQLTESIQIYRQQQDSLKRTIKKLETDTVLIEKIARERYGMVRPGEKVFIVEAPKK